jgi:hypothetical protein
MPANVLILRENESKSALGQEREHFLEWVSHTARDFA